MSRLLEVLDQMTAVLNSLKEVMDAEQLQLSAGQINSNALQRITEDKSSLLATLDYLEQQRRAEQNAGAVTSLDVSQRWQTITQKTLHLRDINQHNGWLLEDQMARNEQAIAVLKPHQAPDFYGADGQATSQGNRGGKKITI
ncbi:flagella synthesis chaperone protein FlgN [Cedecea neteri]|uniref:Flagella biosynthesis chaperone FlgN n=1 Tax=Cedecea neteri TaxID=158822 RepID=A0A089PU79_9ENTR|nr:flagella biosynthesis chaperone FlgN [Cedecea neteri]AIR03882.1 flagellar biosynthesis protein FlgN [Cedecea neteri]ATF93269.1 flagella biosynthesis chaperone FlgN [Cedecea neteri]NWC61658.1 flagella biosynthesis chaperone FlgN [Cedecea sp. P7760]SQC93986.1 flagella synthesis chaperone protein FlgN [Cedecea neteri]